MEYVILEYGNAGDLSLAVGRFIKDGWKPQGGVALAHYITSMHRSTNWAQAMVRQSEGPRG